MQAVVSDKPGCGGWQFAESLQIPTIAYSGGDPANLPRTLDEVHGVDCVALAGFLKAGAVSRRTIKFLHEGIAHRNILDVTTWFQESLLVVTSRFAINRLLG